MIKKTIPSLKQRIMVEKKIKGKSNKEIGQEMYPNATPNSQAVLVSTQLNKSSVAQYYEQSKLQALKEHNITWSRIIKPISDALGATTNVYKNNNATKQVELVDTVPDLNTRLRASKQASELLRVKEEIDPIDPSGLKIPEGIDEIQLVRLMKK